MVQRMEKDRPRSRAAEVESTKPSAPRALAALSLGFGLVPLPQDLLLCALSALSVRCSRGSVPE